MPGSNPQITAVVTAEDHASATLKQIGLLSKEISREANQALGGMAKGSSAAIAFETRRAAEAAKSHLSGLGKFADTVAVGIGLSFAGIVASVGHATLRIGEEMERQQQKLMSYGGLSRREAQAIRDQADSAGARLPGGPIGYETSARAASMSGIPKNKLNDLAPYALLYANETGDDPAKATEDLASHMLMLSHLGKDAAGRPITMDTATHEQFNKAATETMNLLIEVNKTAPGNMANVYSGAKFGGPAAVGFHRDASEFFGFYTEEAKHGIRGDEAGVVYRQAMGALAAPTGKARMAIAAAGLNANDYTTHDLSALTTDNVIAGLSTRIGKTLAEHIRGATQTAIDHFHKDNNVGSLNDAIVTAIQHAGAKNLTDQIKASNVARDIITGSTTTVDLQRFLKDLADHGAGVGALNQIFGKQTGSKIAVVDADEWKKYATQYRQAEGGDNAARALDEWQKSYMGASSYAHGAMTAAEDKLFQEIEPSLSAGLRRFGDMVSNLTQNHPQASLYGAEAIGGVTAAATAGVAIRGMVKFGQIAAAGAKDLAALSGSAVSASARLLAIAGGGEAAGLAGGALTVAAIQGIAAIAIPIAVAVAGAYFLSYKTDPTKGMLNGGMPDADLKMSSGLTPEADFDSGPEAYRGSIGAQKRWLANHGKIELPPGFTRDGSYEPGFGFGYGTIGPIGPADGMGVLADDQWRRMAPHPIPPKPVPLFGAEGSDAFVTAGVNHESGLAKAIDSLLNAFSGPKGARYGGGRDGTTQVEGNVNGEATIMQSIRIDPSPLLIATLQGAQNALKINLSGKLGQTMKGSNAAQGSVGSGLSTFKPTVAGY